MLAAQGVNNNSHLIGFDENPFGGRFNPGVVYGAKVGPPNQHQQSHSPLNPNGYNLPPGFAMHHQHQAASTHQQLNSLICNGKWYVHICDVLWDEIFWKDENNVQFNVQLVMSLDLELVN